MTYYGGSVLPLAVPGTQAAIQLLPFLRPDAGEVAIVSPTYGEYEISFRRAGIEVHSVTTLDAAAATRAGIVVLANPNNPDGRETMRDDVFGFVRATSATVW
jgi:cobalamin biosynthetic protein CobC